MCQKIETSAVDRLLRYDVAAVRCQRLDRICDRRRSGRQGQRCATSLKCRKSLLQYILSRVCKPAVYISCICKTESVCRVLTVVEDIGSGLIDRHGACVCSRVRLFLSDV